MLPVEILIRPATESDLPGVLNLYQTALEDPVLLSDEAALATFRKMQQYPDYTLYVAESGEEIVGTFALLIMDNLGHNGAKSGVVEDVAVLPELQGRGIGREMMAFALNVCRQKHCYKMALSSNLRRTRTHAFYESLGFTRHGFSFVME
ncbi:GNAT family N-acetyltransferase [Siphonobacter aquaeclarae]|uniref:Predicted N-acetyltransferase YhbS n=1 Tax=Siphonobacter aquaeclarae TaxID=563176 RepID=A0A1G9XIS2_9BACT|nr:GNAT family N-acetyltransferase [Siphonobacter aquaeclarae]SDM96617.1 Predicted N-acetyltransferase YhbS [Siphonobacter aquaeclarae]